ncbi:MAG: hypothetical protein M1831_003128 [Alyxoria varia]|nr:MAG: hypothetical protein M1831_003128 [Alyxoria varia]
MAAEPSTSATSKAATKRKSKKGAASTENATIRSPEVTDNQPIANTNEEHTTVGDDSHESPQIKELQKGIRNVNKKLGAMAKLDAIRAEFPDLSPDDLVTTKKINTDQRAQIDKKPALLAQSAQLEEQLGALLKVEENFRKRFKAEKERLETAHRQELEEAKKIAKSNDDESSRKELRQKLLVLSKFLRAAAARRQEEEDNGEDGRGFEGVLLLLYGGDDSAVDAAERVINGTDDKIPSTEGTLLDVNYERVKQLALEFAPFAEEEAWIDNVAKAEEHNESQSTHEENGSVAATTNAHPNASILKENTAVQAVETGEQAKAAAQTSVVPDAANDTANNGLAKTPSEPQGLGDSWVSVPRDTQEPENTAATESTWGVSDEPTNGTASWADETNDAVDRTGFMKFADVAEGQEVGGEIPGEAAVDEVAFAAAKMEEEAVEDIVGTVEEIATIVGVGVVGVDVDAKDHDSLVPRCRHLPKITAMVA